MRRNRERRSHIWIDAEVLHRRRAARLVGRNGRDEDASDQGSSLSIAVAQDEQEPALRSGIETGHSSTRDLHACTAWDLRRGAAPVPECAAGSQHRNRGEKREQGQDRGVPGPARRVRPNVHRRPPHGAPPRSARGGYGVLAPVAVSTTVNTAPWHESFAVLSIEIAFARSTPRLPFTPPLFAGTSQPLPLFV